MSKITKKLLFLHILLVLSWASFAGTTSESGRNLFNNGKEIIKLISKREQKNDATCWTTTRMMENYYVRMPLTEQAVLMKIQVMKGLVSLVWLKQSESLGTDLLSLFPKPIRKELKELKDKQGFINFTSSLFRVDNFQKITENYRVVLSVLLEYLTQKGFFGKKGYSLKPLSQEEFKDFGIVSAYLNIKVLDEAENQRKNDGSQAIEVIHVQNAYNVLKKKLKLKIKPGAKQRDSIELIDHIQKAQDLAKLNIQTKISSLSKYNYHKGIDQAESLALELKLLQKSLGSKVTMKAYKKAREFLLQALYSIAKGEQSVYYNHIASHINDYISQPKELSQDAPLLSMFSVYNTTEDLFPRVTKKNGDVWVYQYINYNIKKPEKFAMLSYKLDSVRDSAIHWKLLSEAFAQDESLILDPFAGELLAERVSELLYFLMKNNRFGKSNPKKIDVKLIDLNLGSMLVKKSKGSSRGKIKKKSKSIVKTTKSYFRPLNFIPKSTSPCISLEEISKGVDNDAFDYSGSGVAVGDYDSDGLIDLFFCRGRV